MNNDIVRALLESLTTEQKEDLIKGLLNSNVKGGVPQLASEDVAPEGEIDNSETDFTTSHNKEPNNTKRKTPVRAKKNKWTDQGELRDAEFDPDDFEKTPRRRGKPSKKQVECHVCGKSFSMNSNLVYGEYVRCNRCTGR
jgi:formylmethanofuran dehydrogenase subunit E